MKKIQKLFSLTLFLSGFFGILLTAPVQADCGGAETAIINCSQSGNGKNVEDNGVWGILIIGLNILTAGVGIVGIGGIVYGAILYASAGDKSGQIEQARNVITNVIIGLVAFALMWAFLQFLIPGGIFS